MYSLTSLAMDSKNATKPIPTAPPSTFPSTSCSSIKNLSKDDMSSTPPRSIRVLGVRMRSTFNRLIVALRRPIEKERDTLGNRKTQCNNMNALWGAQRIAHNHDVTSLTRYGTKLNHPEDGNPSLHKDSAWDGRRMLSHTAIQGLHVARCLAALGRHDWLLGWCTTRHQCLSQPRTWCTILSLNIHPVPITLTSSACLAFATFPHLTVRLAPTAPTLAQFPSDLPSIPSIP